MLHRWEVEEAEFIEPVLPASVRSGLRTLGLGPLGPDGGG